MIRGGAWNGGFEAGDPSACNTYLDPSSLGEADKQVPDTSPYVSTAH